jgi:hypothetical protein
MTPKRLGSKSSDGCAALRVSKQREKMFLHSRNFGDVFATH